VEDKPTGARKNQTISDLLDCVRSHTQDQLKILAKGLSLPSSGSKDELLARFEKQLRTQPKAGVFITEFLNLVDGWGRQHLYLYKAPPGLTAQWRDEAFVRALMVRNGALRVFNRSRALVMPAKPELASVRWAAEAVRFTWNEKRTWFERREALDRPLPGGSGDIVLRGWERMVSRGTLAFDWDLRTGEAMLMIQRLPTGTNYTAARDDLIKLVAPFVDLQVFTATRVSRAILRIRATPKEARERKINCETERGGKASFTTPSRKQGLTSDPTLLRMEQAGSGQVIGSMGNYYWLPTDDGSLDSELHVILHKKDQRVAIFGEKDEGEVRYVVERIRSYCR
jgi:hypothetical protein